MLRRGMSVFLIAVLLVTAVPEVVFASNIAQENIISEAEIEESKQEEDIDKEEVAIPIEKTEEVEDTADQDDTMPVSEEDLEFMEESTGISESSENSTSEVLGAGLSVIDEGNGKDYEWKLYSNGELTISGQYMPLAPWIEEPDSYFPWLKHKDKIFKVILEKDICNISNYAFSECKNLSEIIIPSTVTRIEWAAFDGAKKLKKIDISSENELFIAENGLVFDRNRTTLLYCAAGREDSSFTVPNFVSAIGENAFYGNETLKDIIIPEGITTIGSAAFYKCSSLEYVKLPGSIKMIEGVCTFAYCSSLKSIALPDTLTEIVPAMFESSGLQEIIIPQNVKTIGFDAFSYCYDLRKVTIPEGVREIESKSFWECRSLDNVTIPKSVQKIEWWAFCKCGLDITIKMLGDAPVVAETDVFGRWYYMSEPIVVYVPRGAKGYDGAPWNEYKIVYGDGSSVQNHTVKFHPNGGKVTPTSKTVTYGKKYGTLPTPKRTNYVFQGWYTKKSGGSKVTSSTSVKLTKNQTLYARWKKGGYITYKLNGGKNHASNPSKYYSTKAVTLKNPSRKGYSFGGWYTSKKISKKSKITKIPKGSKGNKTVYAKWTARTYKITYDLNKGKNNRKNPKTYKPTTATITLKNPTRSGYVFAGWYTDSKWKKKVSSIPKGSTGNKKLYARWIKKVGTTVIQKPSGTGDYRLSTAQQFKVTHSKVQDATGYQIQYGTNSTFTKKSGHVVTTKTYKGTSYTATVTGYQTEWWIRVRAYREIGGKTYYGGWSRTAKTHVHNGSSTYKTYTYDIIKNDYKKHTAHPVLNVKCICKATATRKLADIKENHTFVAGACVNCHQSQGANYAVGSFQSSVAGKKVYAGAAYADNYFLRNPMDLSENTQLVKLSMVGSAAAYSDPAAFLKSCGFPSDGITVRYSGTSLSGPTKTDNDHVKFAIGHKVAYDAAVGQYDIYAVLIKGTSGDYEWVSNFNLGEGAMHEGFLNAAEEIVDIVRTYVNASKMTNNVKVWVTGHSRGAAVANVAAHQMNQEYGQDNVYAHTFATPRVGLDGTIQPGDDNIFNFLNPGDFVTEVAPSEWGYVRYGADVYLTNATKPAMESKFETLTRTGYGGFDEGGKLSLVSAFCEFGRSQKDYNDGYENILPEGGTAFVNPSVYCQEGLALVLGADIAKGLRTVLEYSKISEEAKKVTAKMVIDGVVSDHFAHAHCQESYLTWLEAMYP